MSEMGKHFFPAMASGAQRKRIKQLFSSLLMGGAFASWKSSHSIPANIRLNNVRIHLPDGSFNLRAFIAQLEEARRASAAICNAARASQERARHE